MVLEARELQLKNPATAAGDRFTESATLSLLPPSQVTQNSVAGEDARPKNQLTIFYAGSVNVYDDIPEDKANAIMLLAGNAVAGNMNQLLGSLACPEAPTSNPSLFCETSQKIRKLQSSPSPAQSNLLLTLNTQFAARPTEGGFSPSIPRIARPAVPSTGLPQARKASLTRFLQRRKERVIQKSTQSVKEERTSSEFSVQNQDCSPAREGHSAPKDGPTILEA